MGAITGSMTDKKNNKGPNGKKSIFANLDERIEDKFEEIKEQYGPGLTDEEKAEIIVELITYFSDVLEEVVKSQRRVHGNTGPYSPSNYKIYYITNRQGYVPAADTCPSCSHYKVRQSGRTFSTTGIGDTIEIIFPDGTRFSK